MDLITVVEQWLWYLNIAGDIAVVLSLCARSLVSVYRLLFLYAFTDLLQSVLGLTVPDFYIPVYIAGQTLKQAISLLFVIELYGRTLAPQPALSKVGRSAVGGILAVSVAVSLPGLFLGSRGAMDATGLATQFQRFERTVDSTSAVLLLLMSAYLLWFPVKVRRNVASYMSGFIVYFFARWAGLLAIDLWRQYEHALDAATLSIAFACMAFWAVAMRREGETAVTVTGHRWNPLEFERLTLQLDALNARLGRLLRS